MTSGNAQRDYFFYFTDNDGNTDLVVPVCITKDCLDSRVYVHKLSTADGQTLASHKVFYPFRQPLCVLFGLLCSQAWENDATSNRPIARREPSCGKTLII